MTRTLLIPGPSYTELWPAQKPIDEFMSWCNSAGAEKLFWLWHKNSNTGIAVKKAMDPVLFPQLLPRVYIEEWSASKNESVPRLMGDFFSQLEGQKYMDSWDDPLVEVDWQKSNKFVYQDRRPTLHYYCLAGLDRGSLYLAELNMPVRAPDDSVQCFGYSWLIDKDVFHELVARREICGDDISGLEKL